MHHLALCKKSHPGEHRQLRMQLFSQRFESLLAQPRRLLKRPGPRPEKTSSWSCCRW